MGSGCSQWMPFFYHLVFSSAWVSMAHALRHLGAPRKIGVLLLRTIAFLTIISSLEKKEQAPDSLAMALENLWRLSA